jgi:hypothetical protein
VLEREQSVASSPDEEDRDRPPGDHSSSPPTHAVLTQQVDEEPVTEVEVAAEGMPPTTILKADKRMPVRTVPVAIVVAIVVVGGLLAFFALSRSSADRLVRRSMPALGFAVSAPRDWTEHIAMDKGVRSVAFANNHAQSESAQDFRVVIEPSSLEEAARLVVAGMRHPLAGRDPIGVEEALKVSGRRAFRYTYDEGDLYVQQWWIERSGGTFLVEFRSPTVGEHEATMLAERIVYTFSVR